MEDMGCGSILNQWFSFFASVIVRYDLSSDNNKVPFSSQVPYPNPSMWHKVLSNGRDEGYIHICWVDFHFPSLANFKQARPGSAV